MHTVAQYLCWKALFTSFFLKIPTAEMSFAILVCFSFIFVSDISFSKFRKHMSENILGVWRREFFPKFQKRWIQTSWKDIPLTSFIWLCCYKRGIMMASNRCFMWIHLSDSLNAWAAQAVALKFDSWWWSTSVRVESERFLFARLMHA